MAVHQNGDALVFTGLLSRDVVSSLWHELPADMRGLRCLDLRAVERIDSSGLALLSMLLMRAEGGLAFVGDPPGLEALRAAYRLDENLGFAST